MGKLMSHRIEFIVNTRVLNLARPNNSVKTDALERPLAMLAGVPVAAYLRR